MENGNELQENLHNNANGGDAIPLANHEHGQLAEEAHHHILDGHHHILNGHHHILDVQFQENVNGGDHGQLVEEVNGPLVQGLHNNVNGGGAIPLANHEHGQLAEEAHHHILDGHHHILNGHHHILDVQFQENVNGGDHGQLVEEVNGPLVQGLQVLDAMPGLDEENEAVAGDEAGLEQMLNQDADWLQIEFDAENEGEALQFAQEAESHFARVPMVVVEGDQTDFGREVDLQMCSNYEELAVAVRTGFYGPGMQPMVENITINQPIPSYQIIYQDSEPLALHPEELGWAVFRARLRSVHLVRILNDFP